jgi:hypothetical protein
MASSAPPAIGDIPHFPAILYVKPVVGLNEQIFGVNEQISGRGQERLIDISLKVMCETRFVASGAKQRIGFYASLNPDCTATGDVNVRVTKQGTCFNGCENSDLVLCCRCFVLCGQARLRNKSV